MLKVILLTILLMMLVGCAYSPPGEPEFKMRFIAVDGYNKDRDTYEVIEVTGHGHRCYVLHGISWEVKTTLWCESAP